MSIAVDRDPSATNPENQFPVVLRGYDRMQVDDYIARLQAAVHQSQTARAEAEERLAQAQQRLAQSQRALAEVQKNLSEQDRVLEESKRPTLSGLGTRVEQILRLAEEETTANRQAAQREAEGIVSAARLEARDITERAKAEADAMRAAAKRDADNMRAVAQQEAAELVNQAQDDDVRFARRAKDLYRARVGVTYLLPPRGEDLESFYEQVRTRLLQHYVAQGRLRPTDTEAELLSAVLGAEGWKQAFQISVEEGPSHAYGHLRDLVKQEIKRLFRDRETGERPLLPPMADLLAQAAGTEGGGAVEEDDLAQFRQKLAGLVPNGFTPPGSGELKVLISYPGGVRDPIVESYLRDTIYLPRGVVPEFRAVDTETLVVVQFRTSMGVTEVPELRAVLQFWGQAMRREEPQDFLRWRQRLGYDFGYLVTTAEHRVAILHRLLCAMWNGQVRVDEGPIDSPRRILVSLEPEPGPDAPRMALTLVPYAGASSWGSLLRAYEDWALADDESFRRDFCAHLMRTVPDGISETPRPPDPLFETFLKMAGEQLTYLEEHLPRLSEHGRWQAGRLREFWSRTLPDALRLPFSGVASPMYGNLSDLYEEWR